MNAPEALAIIEAAGPAPRRSRQARVTWGGHVVTVGGDAPVRVQSMTNTDTVDAVGTAIRSSNSPRRDLNSFASP